MVERGLCLNDTIAKEAKVDEISELDERGFESLKRVVAQSTPLSQIKTAAFIPQIGVREQAPVVSEYDYLKSSFEKLLQPKTRR